MVSRCKRVPCAPVERSDETQVTLFEILIGRTPFEEDEDERFETSDAMAVYFERARRGEWLGVWSMPDGQSSPSSPAQKG